MPPATPICSNSAPSLPTRSGGQARITRARFGDLDLGADAAPERGLDERPVDAAVADVVGEREQGGHARDEADQRGLGLQPVGARGHDRVALAPARRHIVDVRDEADAADDRGRWDRASVRLVVERDVAGDDRDPEGFRGLRDRLDRALELPRDLGLLRVAEVETVGQRERLAAGARDVQRGAEHGLQAGAERVALAEPRPLERDGETAQRRPQPQHGRVESRAANRARADELVVLAVDPLLAREVRLRGRVRRGPARSRGSRRLAVDVVARALVGEQACGDRADDFVVPERAQLTGRRDLADDGERELPLRADLLDPREEVLAHDRDHPLLALGDHHFPRLEVRLAQRHAVEVHVDPDLARHLRQRRGEPGGAAVLQRLDEPALDELERRFDQLLAGERIADLHRRPLVRVVRGELSAREHRRAADPVATGRRPVQHDGVTRGPRLRARHALAREQPHAHRVHQHVVAIRLVEARLAADVRHADAVPVVADAGDRAAEHPAGVAEVEAVEQRYRPRAHRGDVAQDPADAGRGALKRLDSARVVVALDLEGDRLALAEVDHAGVLAWALEHALALRREAASAAARSACSRSAPTRAGRRRRARSGSGRGRAAPGFGRIPSRSDRGPDGAAVRRPQSDDEHSVGLGGPR